MKLLLLPWNRSASPRRTSGTHLPHASAVRKHRHGLPLAAAVAAPANGRRVWPVGTVIQPSGVSMHCPRSAGFQPASDGAEALADSEPVGNRRSCFRWGQCADAPQSNSQLTGVGRFGALNIAQWEDAPFFHSPSNARRPGQPQTDPLLNQLTSCKNFSVVVPSGIRCLPEP